MNGPGRKRGPGSDPASFRRVPGDLLDFMFLTTDGPRAQCAWVGTGRVVAGNGLQGGRHE